MVPANLNTTIIKLKINIIIQLFYILFLKMLKSNLKSNILKLNLSQKFLNNKFVYTTLKYFSPRMVNKPTTEISKVTLSGSIPSDHKDILGNVNLHNILEYDEEYDIDLDTSDILNDRYYIRKISPGGFTGASETPSDLLPISATEHLLGPYSPSEDDLYHYKYNQLLSEKGVVSEKELRAIERIRPRQLLKYNPRNPESYIFSHPKEALEEIRILADNSITKSSQKITLDLFLNLNLFRPDHRISGSIKLPNTIANESPSVCVVTGTENVDKCRELGARVVIEKDSFEDFVRAKLITDESSSVHSNPVYFNRVIVFSDIMEEIKQKCSSTLSSLKDVAPTDEAANVKELEKILNALKNGEEYFKVKVKNIESNETEEENEENNEDVEQNKRNYSKLCHKPRVEIQQPKHSNKVHLSVVIGDLSMTDKQICQNVDAVLKRIYELRPESAEGKFIINSEMLLSKERFRITPPVMDPSHRFYFYKKKF